MISLNAKSFFCCCFASIVFSIGCDKKTTPLSLPLQKSNAITWFPNLPTDVQKKFESQEIKYSQDGIDIHDWTNRLDKLGYRVDLSVYEGLPKELALRDLQYLEAAMNAFKKFAPDANAAAQTEYVLYNHHAKPEPKKGQAGYEEIRQDRIRRKVSGIGFPFTPAVYGKQGLAPVSIQWLPSPPRVHHVLGRLEDNDSIDLDAEISTFAKYGFPFAQGIYFESGEDSKSPHISGPMSKQGGKGTRTNPKQPWHLSPLTNEKVIGHFNTVAEAEKTIRLGQPKGAELLGKLNVVELKPNILLIDLAKPNQTVERWLGFPIADGNGGIHARDRYSSDEGSEWANEIKSDIHDPRLGRHSLLKVPSPALPEKMRYPQEQIVVGHIFANQKPPVAILRKAKTWQPFAPDFEIDNRQSFFDSDDDTALKAIVFSHIKPKELLQFFGKYHDTNVESLLGDQALIQRLEDLQTGKSKGDAEIP